MATASQQQHQQHPPPSQTPSHEQSHTASEPDPWDGDNGDRMFNIYIWDYCNKRGYKKTCQDLQEEAKLGNEFHPPIDAKQGLLYEWWSVFWVLFGAKNSGTGPDEALVYVQNQQHQHQQHMMRGPNPALGRFQNPVMNGIMPPNPQAGPPQPSANGPTAGIGRGMPPAPGAGPAGPPQTPMQALNNMAAQHMPNGITPGHGGPHPQTPMGQPQQQHPGPGPNGTSQQPSQQNPQGQPSPHNPQQPQSQQQQQQQQQQQHPPQPPPMQHGQTPLGFPGPMPGPGAQQGQAPNQPNGIMGGPHHIPVGHPGMTMAQRGSMGNMGLGGVGRGAGGPPPGFQSPTMAHANPNGPQPPPGQQHPGNPHNMQMPPPYPGMPASAMGGPMRPGMFPPPQPNGAGPTTPGAMNAGTPGSTPGGPPGANQQFGMPGGSRAATPASAGGAGGVGGSALPQRSPSMAAAAVGRGAGPIPGSAGASAAGAGAGRGRVTTKRASVSPGDEPLADPQGNKIEGSPPDRKKPRHSPQSEGAGPQAGPSGTNTAMAGTPQQPPQVPAGGFPPGMRPQGAPPNFPYGQAATQQLVSMQQQQFKPGVQRQGLPGSPSAVAGGSSGPLQQNKPGMSSMMPPPSPLTANMKPGTSTGSQPPGKQDGGNAIKAEGSPRGGQQGGPSQAGNAGPGLGHSPATPAPAAPSPGHTAPASRPGTASSNHVMTPSATPTATQQQQQQQQQQQPSAQPPSSGPPPQSAPVMGAAGNGANGNNAANSGIFDIDFTSNLGISGMTGGMEDFTAMFRDDFERDFGAWFTTGNGGDDMLDPMR